MTATSACVTLSHTPYPGSKPYRVTTTNGYTTIWYAASWLELVKTLANMCPASLEKIASIETENNVPVDLTKALETIN